MSLQLYKTCGAAVERVQWGESLKTALYSAGDGGSGGKRGKGGKEGKGGKNGKGGRGGKGGGAEGREAADAGANLPRQKALICKVLALGKVLRESLKKELGKDWEGKEVLNQSGEGMLLCLFVDLLAHREKGSKLRGGGKVLRKLREVLGEVKCALEKSEDLGGAEKVRGILAGGDSAGDADGFSYVRINPHVLNEEDEETGEKDSLRKERQALRKMLLGQKESPEESSSAPLAALLEADPKVPLCWRAPSNQLRRLMPLSERGDVIIQDRSSQFSAHAAMKCLDELETHTGKVVTLMDACSAPGSKTAHLVHALQMRQRGQTGSASRRYKLIATERDPKRFVILATRLAQLCGPLFEGEAVFEPARRYGGGGELPICGDTFHRLSVGPPSKQGKKHAPRITLLLHCTDFLTLDPQTASFPELARVLVLVLDPSCSGSGLPEHTEEMVTRSQAEEQGAEPRPRDTKCMERVRKLADFQLQMVQQAAKLSKKAVLYSTCSVFREENESVVERALAGLDDEWQLARDSPLGFGWGRDEQGFARSLPWRDQCRGFFLAKLQGGCVREEGQEEAPEEVAAKRRRVDG